MSLNHHGAFPSPSGDREPNELQKELMKRFEQQIEGKAPREYPKGRIAADDDGALVYTVGCDEETGIVRVEFGKPVTWVGLEPQDAVNLAQSLIKHARNITKTPVTIEIN